MKYVIFLRGGMEEVMLFPPWWDHADTLNKFFHGEVISAGKITRNGSGQLYCHGFSNSLKIKSRPVEDLDLILRMLSFTI